MSHRPRSRGPQLAGGNFPDLAGQVPVPGRSHQPGRGEGRKEGDGPRPGPAGLSAHLPQGRKGPRPGEAPRSELLAGCGAAPGERAVLGVESRAGQRGGAGGAAREHRHW